MDLPALFILCFNPGKKIQVGVSELAVTLAWHKDDAAPHRDAWAIAGRALQIIGGLLDALLLT